MRRFDIATLKMQACSLRAWLRVGLPLWAFLVGCDTSLACGRPLGGLRRHASPGALDDRGAGLQST